MKKVAIIGIGYVGTALSSFFEKHFNIVKYDPKIKALPEMFEVADLFVVSVPTPEKADHSVDLDIIYDALARIPENSLVLIKSTIPPGTTKVLEGIHPTLRICFSPEYIGEGKYVVQWWKDKNYPHPTDMKYHDFQIVGGNRTDARDILEFFKTVLGPEIKYIVTDSKTAELCKYMENAWGATKVTFCNEFAKIAETIGVDYDELRELWLLDGRVERMHTAVFKDKRGFGGKCYPKDVNGIVEQSKRAGYTPKLLQAVLSVNEEIKTNQ